MKIAQQMGGRHGTLSKAAQAEVLRPRAPKKIFEGFVARWAQPQEAEKVYAFYNENERDGLVLLRRKELMLEQVHNGRQLVVDDNNGRMIAGATFYELGNGASIDCIRRPDNTSEAGVPVECASVFKVRKDLRGFFQGFIFSTLMIETFRRAMNEEMHPHYVICAVMQDEREKNNIARLTKGDEHKKTGMRWLPFTSTDDLKEVQLATFDPNDPNCGKAMNFLRAPANSLPDVASYFWGIVHDSYIDNRRNERLKIDVTQLGLADTCSKIRSKADTVFNVNDNVSWLECARQMGRATIPVQNRVHVAEPKRSSGLAPMQHSAAIFAAGSGRG